MAVGETFVFDQAPVFDDKADTIVHRKFDLEEVAELGIEEFVRPIRLDAPPTGISTIDELVAASEAQYVGLTAAGLTVVAHTWGRIPRALIGERYRHEYVAGSIGKKLDPKYFLAARVSIVHPQPATNDLLYTGKQVAAYNRSSVVTSTRMRLTDLALSDIVYGCLTDQPTGHYYVDLDQYLHEVNTTEADLLAKLV